MKLEEALRGAVTAIVSGLPGSIALKEQAVDEIMAVFSGADDLRWLQREYCRKCDRWYDPYEAECPYCKKAD